MYMEARGQHSPYFKIASLIGSGAHWSSLTGYLPSSGIAAVPDFDMGTGDLNSSPHVCTVSTD